MSSPKIILLFSGKRKSGKDHTVLEIQKLIGEQNCEIIRISEPIKSHWAKHLNLNLTDLLGDGPYKEKYRADMVTWSENVRKSDYGIFCRAACENADRSKAIWIVSDIRRKTDLKWFRENYPDLIKTVRIIASNEIRKDRGWVHKNGVDDAETECDLDDVQNWDYKIRNDFDVPDYQRDLKQLENLINIILTN